MKDIWIFQKLVENWAHYSRNTLFYYINDFAYEVKNRFIFMKKKINYIIFDCLFPCFCFICRFTFVFLQKVWLQMEHLKGFSPVWTRICISILSLLLITLPQIGQTNSSGPSFIGPYIFCNKFWQILIQIFTNSIQILTILDQILTILI